MWQILNVKFAPGTEMRKLLEATKGAGAAGNALVEHCQPGAQDQYWSDHGDGTGSNTLGRLLMALRDNLSSLPPANTSGSVDPGVTAFMGAHTIF